MVNPILIVEDEPDGQIVVSRMLDIANVPYELANNGEDAWRMVQNGGYSMAIIDLALPGIDGLELLGRIRANSVTTNIPCIAVTAFHTPELKQQAIAEGFDTYFPKPINRTLLLSAIDKLGTQ
jgi:CheY-like chemotaxis protein